MKKENVIDAIEFKKAMDDRGFFIININKVKIRAYGYEIRGNMLKRLDLLGKDGKTFMLILLDNIKEIY